jgi:hypothetical protein
MRQSKVRSKIKAIFFNSKKKKQKKRKRTTKKSPTTSAHFLRFASLCCLLPNIQFQRRSVEEDLPFAIMTDADVFAKLSRIIETQDFSDDDGEPVEDMLESLAANSGVKKSPPHQGRDHVTFQESSLESKSRR